MLTNLTNRECDRFIHQRNHFKFQQPETASPDCFGQPSTNYNYLISKRLFNKKQNNPTFKLIQQIQECKSQLSAHSNLSSKLNSNVQSPIKILDIPNFKDDFYLNNIDWSQNGPLGIALKNEVYLYAPDNISQIFRSSFKQEVTGIKMCQQIMGVGSMDGSIQMYDIDRGSLVRTLFKHENRVASLMFMDGLLVSGSKDKTIVVHDLRQRFHVVKEYAKHKGQICTLKAKNKTQKIFASGSADGSAMIWDLNYGFIDQLKGHKGAVKALDWCPWKSGILATGGGNQTDKSIKLWNTNTSKLILQEPIQNQISGIVWNENLKLMITSHGHSQNQLNFWNLNSTEDNNRWRLEKKKKFEAHSRRVLNMLQSPDGNFICTAGGDQSLKLWRLQNNDHNPFSVCNSRAEEQNLLRI